jgi:hypothetical protein
VWSEATRRAEEAVSRINVESLSLLTPENAQSWLPSLVVAKFKVWAERGIHVVWSDAAMDHYGRWLVSYANSWLDEVSSYYEREPQPIGGCSSEHAVAKAVP